MTFAKKIKGGVNIENKVSLKYMAVDHFISYAAGLVYI